MLEVEEPPKLGPWKPMSFEELYAAPIKETTNQPTRRKSLAHPFDVPVEETKTVSIVKVKDSIS
jgi:hypothetical protein